MIETLDPKLKSVEDTAPPPMYSVLAVASEQICEARLASVLITVFEKNAGVAFKLAARAASGRTAICGIYPREIAEMKVQQAKKAITNEVNGCECLSDRKITFWADAE